MTSFLSKKKKQNHVELDMSMVNAYSHTIIDAHLHIILHSYSHTILHFMNKILELRLQMQPHILNQDKLRMKGKTMTKGYK